MAKVCTVFCILLLQYVFTKYLCTVQERALAVYFQCHLISSESEGKYLVHRFILEHFDYFYYFYHFSFASAVTAKIPPSPHPDLPLPHAQSNDTQHCPLCSPPPLLYLALVLMSSSSC